MRKIAATTLLLIFASGAQAAATQEEITWACGFMGDVAKQYAVRRDAGVKLDAIQKEIDGAPSLLDKERSARKLTAQIVYQRPDLTPEVTRKVFIASCTGGMSALHGKGP